MCRSKVKIDSNQDKVETQLKGLDTKEHDKIVSRITGYPREIEFGPIGGGLVKKNPFASAAQRGFMHANPSVLGKAGLAEWDKASKGQHVPYKVKGKK
jgi:hypothetical protein